MYDNIVRARFLGPTNTRGSRVNIRWNDSTTKTVPVNYGWNSDNVKREAAAEANGVPTSQVDYLYELPNGDTIYGVTLHHDSPANGHLTRNEVERIAWKLPEA